MTDSIKNRIWFANNEKIYLSGRTEKQAVRDALQHARTPPSFSRTPSKRQPRRTFDDLHPQQQQQQHQQQQQMGKDKSFKHEIKSVSIPQPAQS